MTTNAVAILFGVLAADTRSAGLFGVSGAMYVLGGPIVHWVHGGLAPVRNVGKGFGSLALRVGLPLVFGGIGAAMHPGGEAWAFIIGAGIGAIPAMVIDWAGLAYEPVAPDHAASATTDLVDPSNAPLATMPNGIGHGPALLRRARPLVGAIRRGRIAPIGLRAWPRNGPTNAKRAPLYSS